MGYSAESFAQCINDVVVQDDDGNVTYCGRTKVRRTLYVVAPEHGTNPFSP